LVSAYGLPENRTEKDAISISGMQKESSLYQKQAEAQRLNQLNSVISTLLHSLLRQLQMVLFVLTQEVMMMKLLQV
jgi:hypothetical protein